MGEKSLDFDSLGFFQKWKMLYFHPREYFRVMKFDSYKEPLSFAFLTWIIGTLPPIAIKLYIISYYEYNFKFSYFLDKLLTGSLAFSVFLLVPLFLLISILSKLFVLFLGKGYEFKKIFTIFCYTFPVLILIPLIISPLFEIATITRLFWGRDYVERIIFRAILGLTTLFYGYFLYLGFYEIFEKSIKNFVLAFLLMLSVYELSLVFVAWVGMMVLAFA